MIQEIHARIHALLQGRNVPLLPGGHAADSKTVYNKAGVIPYNDTNERRYLVMKPVAKHPDMPPPAFQLCKGTRMCAGPNWRDLKDGMAPEEELEPLITTALREGVEELGFHLQALQDLCDLGPYGFASARGSAGRQMWLFAGQMQNEADLLPLEAIAQYTTERAWLTLAEFQKYGRADHAAILAHIDSRLNTR